jgi:hypothetical protein
MHESCIVLYFTQLFTVFDYLILLLSWYATQRVFLVVPSRTYMLPDLIQHSHLVCGPVVLY